MDRLRRAAQRPNTRLRLERAAASLWNLSQSAETPRASLLALSEVMRRQGGDRPAISDQQPLTGFELRVTSQNGEDGVLIELLRRAGDGGRWFAEIGAGAGDQSNCVVLADVLGWSGLLLDGDPARAARLRAKYAGIPAIRTRCALAEPANVDELLAESKLPRELDVLSIDVDGADYWIWRAMRAFTPRILIIEYNASLGAEERLVQPENRPDTFDRTSYGGASIAALCELGEARGYRLVHTELTGNNAFFVRRDQPGVFPEGDAVPLRGPNHYLRSQGHQPDARGRRYVVPAPL